MITDNIYFTVVSILCHLMYVSNAYIIIYIYN